MIPAPSRNVRRRLERRADRVLDRVQDRIRGVPMPFAPTNVIGLAQEPASLLLFDRDTAAVAFDAYDLSNFLGEIEAARDRNPTCLPIVIKIGGWACCAWVPMTPMSMGGAA